MKIGVMALQGGFAEHVQMLRRLGADAAEIRTRQQLNGVDGLILPGGESTVMRKLLTDLGFFVPLQNLITEGLPVFGTCAGLILLAREVEGGEPVFPVLDIRVRRNAYGRQLGSFHASGNFAGGTEIPMIFIRAPRIEAAGANAEVLVRVRGAPAAVRQNTVLGAAFHPELTGNTAVHAYFLGMVRESGRSFPGAPVISAARAEYTEKNAYSSKVTMPFIYSEPPPASSSKASCT